MYRSLICILVCLACQCTFAAPHCTVEIDVDADTDLKAKVTSYIAKDLRNLRDVEIVTNNADFTINVIAVERRANGDVAGYEFSVVATEQQVMPESFYQAIPVEQRQRARNTINGSVLVVMHRLMISPAKGLKENCTRLVATFDNEVLSRSRKAYPNGRPKRQAEIGTAKSLSSVP